MPPSTNVCVAIIAAPYVFLTRVCCGMQTINTIGGYDPQAFVRSMRTVVLYFTYIAFGTLVASYAEVTFWMLTGMLAVTPAAHQPDSALVRFPYQCWPTGIGVPAEGWWAWCQHLSRGWCSLAQAAAHLHGREFTGEASQTSRHRSPVDKLSAGCANAGAHQANRTRRRYLDRVLRADIAYFDKHVTTGELLQGLNEDCTAIQDAIGEKVGNFVHHLSTFIVGYGIGEPMKAAMQLHSSLQGQCGHGTTNDHTGMPRGVPVCMNCSGRILTFG